MATRKTTDVSIEVQELRRETFEVVILGESPLIMNAMSAKAMQQLLLPPGRKTGADKASTLKHQPYAEFVRSMYTARSEDADTLAVIKATAPKGAIMGAALDMPGATKTKIGRLLFVEGIHATDEIGIFGVPEMMMAVTRSADINKTPDVRTRAIFPTWCAKLRVTYTVPLLNQRTVANLLAAAGMTQGIGDWRVEKGSGNYGRFQVVDPQHPVVQMLMSTGNREAQIEAIKSPAYYDSETEELASWYDSEIERRGMTGLLDKTPAMAEMND